MARVEALVKTQSVAKYSGFYYNMNELSQRIHVDSKVYGTTLNIPKQSPVIDEKLLSLGDILQHPHPYQLKHIISAYCNDLENILSMEDIRDISLSLLAVSDLLTDILKDRKDLDRETIPRMQRFYFKLSPVLLHMFSQDIEDYNLAIIETIRIALEDELFLWKEHLMGL